MVIALVDPFFKGHHETYMKLFTLTLLKQNHTVLVLNPLANSIKNYIQENLPEKASQVFTHQISEVSLSIKIPVLFHYYILTIKRWILVKKAIAKSQKLNQIKVDFVFFNWLDSYLFKYIPTWFLNLIFPYKWSGLYFHANHVRKQVYAKNAKANFLTIDNVLRSKNCKNIALLDRFIQDDIANRINKKTIAFPDITNTVFSGLNTTETYKIIEPKIKGRTTIGIIGIEKRKNILSLIRTALKADTTKFYFIILGKINYTEFSDHEQLEITHFIDNLPEHCYYNNVYLNDGDEFNSVFNLFSIPWVVYSNFYSASNILVKAAYFKKLVIGSNQYCIADCIKNYNLGYTVNPYYIEDILDKLALLSNQQNALNLLNPKFDEFYQINSLEALENAFKKVLHD